MKKILIAIFLINHFTSIADNDENKNSKFTILYKAIYSVNLQPDSNDVNSKLSDQLFTLFIGNQVSIYAANKQFMIDSIIEGVENGSINAGNVLANIKRMPKPVTREKIVKYLNKNVINYFNQLSSSTYLYTEKLNIIKWNIQRDTKVINNYKCQKAIGNYAGRDYEAWFTNEIPIPDGPYKFNGLPGLIIKIYDKKEHYVFELKHFQRVDNIQKSIAPTSKPINTSKKEFWDFKKDFFSNPIPYLESEGAVFDQKNKEIIKERFKSLKQRNNNPIELVVE